MRWLLDTVVDQARWVLVLSLLLTAGSLVVLVDFSAGSLRLRIDPSAEVLLPPGGDTAEALRPRPTHGGRRGPHRHRSGLRGRLRSGEPGARRGGNRGSRGGGWGFAGALAGHGPERAQPGRRRGHRSLSGGVARVAADREALARTCSAIRCIRASWRRRIAEPALSSSSSSR